MDERKLIGLAAVLIGVMIIAPNATSIVLQALSKPPKTTIKIPHDTPNAVYDMPIIEEQVGIIRQCKNSIIDSSKRFWKWFY